jgi:hypothetical protein
MNRHEALMHRVIAVRLTRHFRILDHPWLTITSSGVFSFWFPQSVALGTPSCKPKSKIACANSDGCGGLILCGSGRSAKLGPKARLGPVI